MATGVGDGGVADRDETAWDTSLLPLGEAASDLAASGDVCMAVTAWESGRDGDEPDRSGMAAGPAVGQIVFARFCAAPASLQAPEGGLLLK